MTGSFWSFAETTALLNLWGDISVQCQLDSARRNRPIFQRLQQDLAALGFIRTWQQCRVKIKNVTATYRKLRDSNRRSGRGRANLIFYCKIDGVLGTRPATQPMNLLSSTSSNSAPPLDRPGVSEDDSEEATTDNEEDDEVEDGEENGGGSGSPPGGSGSGSHSGGGGSWSPSGDGPSSGSESGSRSGDGPSSGSLSGNHSGGGSGSPSDDDGSGSPSADGSGSGSP